MLEDLKEVTYQKKWFIAAIILLFLIGLAEYFIYINLIHGKITKYEGSIKAEEQPEDIFDASELYPESALSYFECSYDKKKALQSLCINSVNVGLCESRIITAYIMYMYKSKKTANYEFIGKKMYELADIEPRPDQSQIRLDKKTISESYLKNVVYDFITTETISGEWPNDLKILKIDNEDEILSIYKENDVKYAYFTAILSYKKAGSLEDCNKIVVSDFNERTSILKDACILTFSGNNPDYCINSLR